MIRGSTKIFLETLAACVLVAVLLAGFVAWRLGNGPISIDSVTPYIESALSDPSSGRRVSIGASGLIWDPSDHAIEVRADRVSVFDAAGQAVIVVPEMTLRFHLAALMRGIFAPRTVTLIRPAVTVIRTAEGGWQISAVPESEQAAAASGDATLALDLAARSLSQLDRFRLVDARLTIDDRRAHALWVVPEMSIALTRERDRFIAESAVALDVDGQRVPVRATVRLDASFNLIDADVAVAELVPAKIARRAAELSDVASIDLPLGGTVHITQQVPGGPELRFAITGGAGQLVRPELVDGALPVSSLTARGSYRIGAQDLQLDELALVLPTTSITLTGTAHDLGGDAAVEGKLAVGGLPLDDLHKYWPPDVAPNPRRWMLANLSQGTIRDTALRFAGHRVGSSVTLDALDGSMAVDGARVRYLKGQPAVEQVAGAVRFDAQHFDIAISAGRLRGLKIDSAQLTISGLADHDQQMAMSVALSGPLSDALVVLDMPPFGYVRRLGRAPQSITGDMTGRLSLKFPLIDRLTLDDIGLGATASLSALRVPKVVRDFDLTEGKFDLNLDKAGLRLIGQGQIGGVPASLGWTENFERTAAFQRRYDVAATLTDDGRRALGIELDDYLSGPVALTMNYSDLKNGRSSLVGTVDLGAAALKLDDLSWKKPAGRPATGQFEARLIDGRLTSLERAELSGGGLTLRASGGFGAQGRLAKLDIAQLKVDATDVAAQLAWDGERVDIALSGRSLDASTLFGADDVGTKPPRAMTVSAKLDRVIVGAGRALDKVDLRADSDGTRWRTAAITGIAGAGAMRLTLAPRAAGRDLTITGDDAGGVLKTFGITNDMQGGKLRIDGRYDDTVAIDRLEAKVAIDAYRLVRAPLLAKMLAVTSITGIPDLLSGDGIGFQELSMQVVKSPNRLEIVDGRTSGRAMGLTVQGTIQGPDDIADLTGTLVPVASVNRLFESIPLIGDIVTGGGGGLFAFTYAVHGPMDNPSVTLNPLSVLAPGFLRNLFRWQLPGGGASSMPPASTSGQ